MTLAHNKLFRTLINTLSFAHTCVNLFISTDIYIDSVGLSHLRLRVIPGKSKEINIRQGGRQSAGMMGGKGGKRSLETM